MQPYAIMSAEKDNARQLNDEGMKQCHHTRGQRCLFTFVLSPGDSNFIYLGTLFTSQYGFATPFASNSNFCLFMFSPERYSLSPKLLYILHPLPLAGKILACPMPLQTAKREGIVKQSRNMDTE